MDNHDNIVPPHLNAEVYRTDTTGTNTLSYLDYIQLHEDGSVLVGCSELTGRYWNGAVCVFNSIQDAQEGLKESKKSVNLNSGTANGCFVESSSRFLTCEDNGTVSIWSKNIEDAWKQWNLEVSAAEHDDSVLAVSCLDSGREYVTAGADGNVKVWDIKEMICIKSFNSAHSRAVESVAGRPKSKSCFATGSLDQYISLWDENVAKPVCDLVKNSCGIYCLQWLDDNRLVFGDEAGTLGLVDVRNPHTDTNFAISQFPAAIHNIVVKPESSSDLAVCCDNRIMTVCNITDVGRAQTLYTNNLLHSNFVRDVAWDLEDDKTFYSVGWDGDIKTHNI